MNKRRFDPSSLGKVDPDEIAASRQRAAPVANPLEGRIRSLELMNRSVGVQAIRLKPSECVVWEGNARTYANLTYEHCEELIQSIISEHGNRVPVVVRSRTGARPGEPQFELLVGTRRHWSVAWANQNHYPDISLLAIVDEVSDEEAFRVADLENRARTDITVIERGRNYRAAIDSYYGGVQSRMAERLRITPGHLSYLLSVASLPQQIIDAFPSEGSITMNGIKPVLQAYKAEPELVLSNAAAVAADQASRREKGVSLLDAATVIRMLIARPAAAPVPKEHPMLISADGRQLGRVLKNTKKELVIQIDPRGDGTTEEVLEALRPAIEAAKALASNGRSKR